MTTQKNAADILERLAELEAREADRQRQAEEQLAAQRRLDELRPDKISNVRLTDTKEDDGTLRCFNEDCSDAYKPAGKVKMRGETTTRFFRDADGSVTERPENTWTHWHVLESESHLLTCPTCGETRQALIPGATDAWDGQRRKLKTERWGTKNVAAEREAQAWNDHLKTQAVTE
jgi:hypothetical protein